MATPNATPERLQNYLKLNSIHYYMESGSKHMFVYNNSYGYAKKDKELCAVVIPVGDSFTCKIPATKLPVDLTEQVPFDKLIESSHIRQYLQKQLLKICPEDEALKKLNTQEAEIEMKKLRETMPDLSSMYKQENIEVLDSKVTASKSPEALDIDLTVMETLNQVDFSDDEKYITIRNIEDRLQKKDWQFILENSDNEKLKELATSHL